MIDWRTDEGDEQVWKEERVQPLADSPRRWPWLLLLLLLLVGLGTWVGFHISERIQRNLKQVRDQVRQHHSLVYEAALAQDHALFDYFTAASDIEWRVLQRLLLQENLLLNRAPLNLWIDQSASPTLPETAVSLSANLSEAAVQTIYPYLAQTIDGEQVRVRLRHTSFYKKRGELWYAAPADDAYWGASLEYQGEVLQTFYTERDRLIARRFAEDLDAFVAALCQDQGLLCTDAVPLRLLFQTDQTALYRLTDNVRLLNTKRVIPNENGRYDNVHEISLPTPSLVGYPMDEPSYEALYRGYAAWVGLLLLQNRSPGLSPSHTENVATLARYGLLPPAVPRYTPLTAAEPPIPLPDASLYLMCADTDGISAWLYDVPDDAWLELGAPFELTTVITSHTSPSLAPDFEAQLLDAVPRADRPLQLSVSAAVAEGERVGVLAHASQDAPFYFVFVQDEGALVYLDKVRKGESSAQAPAFEGNGRFLTVPIFNYGRTTVHLIDIEQRLPRQTYSFASRYPSTVQVRWAPDGRWFAIVDDRAIRLVSPETGFEKVIYHNIAGCRLGEWTLSDAP